jgi:hypothetical protein
MKRSKKNIFSKAGVLFVAVAMVISIIPAVTADTDDFISDPQVVLSKAVDTTEFDFKPYTGGVKTGMRLPYADNGAFDGGLGSDAWISYNDGYTENSLGLTAGGIMTMAIELTDTELASYRTYDIDEIYVSIGSDAYAPGDVCNYVVWIEDTLPADPYGAVNVVATGTSTDVVWQTIDVTDYAIPDTGSVFIGVNLDHVAGQHPCGMDESQSGPVRGALLNYVGGTGWTDLFAIAFPAVWGLDIGVTEGGGPGPVGDCLEDVCDFELVALNQAYMYEGKINELPQIINITVRNNGELGINEVKLLADVYKKVCGPTSTLYCDEKFDLRFWETETADIFSQVDDGDGDTWILQGGAENRWATNNQAWRCTPGEDRSYGGDVDTYLGLCDTCSGADELIFNPIDPEANEISGAACATFTFSHWCEGEYTFDDDGYVIPVDYGFISYRIDDGSGTVAWTDLSISDFVAYDTDGEWEDVTIKFLNQNIFSDTSYAEVCDDCDPADDDIVVLEAFPVDAFLEIKFSWVKDPCYQFEGWYVDNLCITRTEMYTLELVHQAHEIISLDGCDWETGPVDVYVEFELGWDPEPDTWYQIDICGQVFSPNDCEFDTENNCYSVQFYVTDIHDVMCKSMNVITAPPYVPGDSITVNMTVKNIGSFAEDGIPVVLKVADCVVDPAISDDFETDPSGRWNFYYFGGYSPESLWDWTNGDPSISNIWDVDEISARSVLPGSESLICAHAGSDYNYPYLSEGTGCLVTDDVVYDFMGDGAMAAELTYYAKWSLEFDGVYEGTQACMLIHPTTGPDSAYWWIIDFGAWNHGGVYHNDWIQITEDMIAWQDAFSYIVGSEVMYPPIEFGWGVFAHLDDGDCSNPLNPVPWSGFMLDRIELDVVACAGSETIVDEKTVPGTLAPGDEATVQLNWDAAEFCSHCLIADVNLPTDVDTSNDICSECVLVSDQTDIGDFTSMDLTGQGDCLWHLCDSRGGGDDTYAWSGVEEPTWAHYINDMDDSFISPAVNLSACLETPFNNAVLNFTQWYDFADEGDFGEIYVRGASSDPWTKIGEVVGGPSVVFQQASYVLGPEMCTSTFQVKFRMVSDDEGISEGWYIDDVEIFRVSESGAFSANYVGYSDGWTDNAMKWTSGAPCMMAIELGPTELSAYYDDVITEVVWSIGADDYPSYITPCDVDIWIGTSLPAFSSTPDYTFTGDGLTVWQTFPVSYDIPSSGTVFVTIKVSNYGGNYPVGMDENTADTTGRAAHMVDVDEVTWTTLGGIGYGGVHGAEVGIDEGTGDLIYGAIVWSDDFERENIAPWQCLKTRAGDFWEHYTSDTGYLPSSVTEDYNGDDDWWVVHGYPSTGPGLNDIIYTELDFTDELITSVQLHFAMAWLIETGCEAFIEISEDYDEGDPMHDATWIPFWHMLGDGSSSGGWLAIEDIVNDGRFVLNQYLGQKVYLRFRYTTPGEGSFSAAVGHGWAIDGLSLEFKADTFEDNEPPVTSIFFNQDTGKVTLIAEDYPINKGSGVKATYYKIDGGSQTTYTGAFSIGEGTHTVEYWSVDNADNAETHKTATFIVDSTAPTVELTSPEEGKLYLFGSPVMDRIIGSGTLCIGKVPVAANADDGTGSGVSMVMFSFSNGDSGFDDDGSDGFTYTFKSMHFGALTITAVAIDNAGLTSTPDSMEVTVYSLGLM